MVIELVSPFALHVPVALVTVTAAGPVIIKSLPLEAIELHKMLSVKFRVIVEGEQFGGGTVPIGMEGCGASANWVLLPAVTWRLHWPIKAFPSVPFAICTV